MQDINPPNGGKKAGRVRPSDQERLASLMQLEGPMLDLRQVLDTLIELEFQAGVIKRDNDPFMVHLNAAQRDGIAYMALHVCNLAEDLSNSFRVASDGEESVQ